MFSRKMQGRQLKKKKKKKKDRHGEGSQKQRKKNKKTNKQKKHKAKNHEDCNPIKECGKKTGAEGELQELKNQVQPTHATAHSDSKTKIPVPTI